MAAALIILVILTIAAVIATYAFILSDKRAHKLSPFWLGIRDFLKMKTLYLEKVLRGLYVVSSVVVFVMGIGMSIIMMVNTSGNFILGLLGGLLTGLLSAAIILFILRISYESIMLNISLTQAAKSIDQKLGGNAEPRARAEAPRRLPQQSRLVTCRYCGARFDPRRGYCPNCDERA